MSAAGQGSPEQVSPKGRRHFIRKSAMAAAVLVGVVGGIIGVVGTKNTARYLIRAGADLAGLGPVSLTVTEAGWRGIVAQSLGVGADASITAKQVAVSFGFFGPLGGPQSIAIQGLRVEKTLGKDGGGTLKLPAVPQTVLIILDDTAIRFHASSLDYSAIAPGRISVSRTGASGRLSLALTPANNAAGAIMPHGGTLTFSGGGTAPQTLALDLAPTGPVDIGRAHLTLSALIKESAQGAQLSVQLREAALPALGIAVTGLSLDSDVRVSADHVVLTLDRCAAFTGLTLAHAVFDRLPVCSEPGKPLLSIALEKKGPEAVALDARLQEPVGRYLGKDGMALIKGTWPTVHIAAKSSASFGDAKSDVHLDGGALTGPTGLTLSATSGDLHTSTQNNRLSDLHGALKFLLSDQRQVPLIVPITAAGTAKTENGVVRFTASAAGAGLAQLFQAQGSHDLAAGVGTARVVSAPLTFAPNGFSPVSLSPALKGKISEVKGTVSAEGVLTWGSAGLASHGLLRLAKLAARVPLARFDGLDGAIDFASLFPLMTAKPQTLKAGLLDLGLPLTDGIITLSLSRGGDLLVHDAHWSWMGGTIGLASAVFSPFRSEQALTLAVDKIDLKRLIDLADVHGLTATGLLSGRIPVTLQGAHQWVRDGKLEAVPPGGTIIYKTGSTIRGTTSASAILYTALDNFQYDALNAELTGDLAGTLSLQVHLKGRNPDLYDGRRIELNISTEGAFVDMLRKGLAPYRGGNTPQ